MKKPYKFNTAQKVKALLGASGLLALDILLRFSTASAAVDPGGTGAPSGSSGGDTSSNPIVHDITVIVNFLSAAIGLVIVGLLILGGIQYAMAGDSPEGVNKAKQRISKALIALIAFLFMFAFVQWLVPGGVF